MGVIILSNECVASRLQQHAGHTPLSLGRLFGNVLAANNLTGRSLNCLASYCIGWGPQPCLGRLLVHAVEQEARGVQGSADEKRRVEQGQDVGA